MGMPSETDVALEAAVEGADGARSVACIVVGRDARGGGCDGLPMRNSRISASSSWIPTMAAP
jgi:hypothetical protein